jgi:hypothetical protein
MNESFDQLKIQATILNLLAEFEKTLAETRKINTEDRWYPLVACLGAGAALFVAGGAFAKLFL